MNRQTYSVKCCECGVALEITSPVLNSTGICPACLEDLRAEAKRQFTPSLEQKMSMDLGLTDIKDWRDLGAKGRQQIIASVPAPFSWDWGSFLIGTAFGVLVFISLQWLIHFH